MVSATSHLSVLAIPRCRSCARTHGPAALSPELVTAIREAERLGERVECHDCGAPVRLKDMTFGR